MSIQQQVYLRYRSEGHVRFSVPAALCAPSVGDELVERLNELQGVFRVDLYRKQRKLVIRYLDSARTFAALVRDLISIVGNLSLAPNTASSASTTTNTSKRSSRMRLGQARPIRWLRGKYQEVKETVQAAGILAKRKFGNGNNNGAKKWITEFANDLLMLYLITTHWHMITTEWLRHPWRHRNHWLATVYLIYLLVRSKMPKAA